MDLKYNLAQTWLLRDRSPLPITTLEVIKDSPEFVTLASSEHLERSIFFLNSIFRCMKRARYVWTYILDLIEIYWKRRAAFFLSERHDPDPSL